MHAANRRAWDEAAERYEGWFAEAVELISSGGTNLLRPELELIGDLHGRCRRAIHLQCAGGRDTLSLWNLGADEVIGVDFSPRMLALAERLLGDRGRASTLDRGRRARHAARARWDGRPRLHGSRLADVAAGPRCVGRRARTACWLRAAGSSCSRAIPPSGCSTSMRTGRWIATDYDYFAGPEASKGWAPEYIDRLSIEDDDQSLEVRPRLDARRDRHGPPGLRTPRRAARRAPDRLVGRPRRRPRRRARSDPPVVLGAGASRRLAGRACGLVHRHPRAIQGELDDGRALLDERLAKGGLEVGIALDVHATSAERPADAPRSRPVRARSPRLRRSPGVSCHIRIVPNRSLSKTRTMIRAPSRTAVSSSAMVIAMPPSPTSATTGRSRWTSDAAIAAGTP